MNEGGGKEESGSGRSAATRCERGQGLPAIEWWI